MGSRTILYFTLFLAIAGVAGIFARAYFSDQTAEASAEPVLTGPKIIVANRSLDVGAFLTSDDIRWQATPANSEVMLSQHFLEGAASIDNLLGAVVRRRLEADQPLTMAQVIKPGQRGFLAAVLKPGMRAVTVSIDKVSGNSGLVFRGDHVDLILTLELKEQDDRLSRRLASETILSNVRVIAIGQRVESFAQIEAQQDERLATTATLEVAPQHAERIHVAQELGRLALSLRSLAEERLPEDQQIVGGVAPDPNAADLAAQTTWAADVSSALRMQEQNLNKPPPPPPSARPRAAAAPTLMIMKGGDRQTVPTK